MGIGRGGTARRCVAGLAATLLLGLASDSLASPRELKAVSAAIKAKGKRWLAQETSVSRLPGRERKLRLGLIRPAAGAAPAPETGALPPATGIAPASFDWRNNGGSSFVTPVRNQGGCGSCWAFATTAALESSLLIATGAGGNLAEQILLSCSGAGSCDGGYIDRASNFIRDTGLPDEAVYPYTAGDGTCTSALAGWQNATAGITSWHYVGGSTSPSETQIKEELVAYGPLVTTMAVYSDFFYYGGGVYQHVSGTYQGGHAILLVGYDDAQQCFIAKNSWGAGWGESGFFKIGYTELADVVGFGRWSQAYYTDNASPSLTLRTPNGSESFDRGTPRTIQWAYSGRPGAAVDIALYDNDAPLGTIASGVPIGAGGIGAYSWSIPADQPPGSGYGIRVSTADGAFSDMSDGHFAITIPVPPSVTVVTPNGGEVWSRGTQQRIAWSSTGYPGANLRIELLSAGSPVATLTSKAKTAAGAYVWRIPSKRAPGGAYAVRVTSTLDPAVTDTSDALFTIR